MHQACSIEQNYFNEPAEGIAVERIFKKYVHPDTLFTVIRSVINVSPRFHGKEGDENKVTEYATQLDGVLAVYDTILAEHKYLAGDEVTLADLYHLPYGKLAKDIGFTNLFEKYPHVKRWFESLEARDSWKKVGHVSF